MWAGSPETSKNQVWEQWYQVYDFDARERVWDSPLEMICPVPELDQDIFLTSLHVDLDISQQEDVCFSLTNKKKAVNFISIRK